MYIHGMAVEAAELSGAWPGATFGHLMFWRGLKVLTRVGMSRRDVAALFGVSRVRLALWIGRYALPDAATTEIYFEMMGCEMAARGLPRDPWKW